MNTDIFKFLNNEESTQNMRFESLEDLQNAFALNDPFTDIRVDKVLLGEETRGMANVHPLVTKKIHNRTTKEITRLYFPDAEKQFLQNQGIYFNIDIDCEEARKLLVKSSDFFYDYNKNGIVDDGEYAFKLHVFSSKNSKKLKEAFDCVTPKDSEMLVFIEDNVDDWSRQWVRIKLGEKLKATINRSSLHSKSVFNAINRNVTGLSQESLKQLVEKGEIEEELTITSAFLSGLGYLMLVISAPLKLVGWLVEKIGVGIGYLKLPAKVWDVQNEDYIFNEENIKDVLTIDISVVENLEKELTTGKLKQAFYQVIPKEASKKITDTITQLKTYITNYNSFVGQELDTYDKPERDLLEQQVSIGLMAGLYNGIIDFISSTLRFIGKLFEAPFDITNDWQGFLETVDNIFLYIEDINWKELHAGLKLFFELIMSKLRDKDGELDLVRVAYVMGFAIVFVGTLFIPIAGWIGKTVKLEKLIPQELLAILHEGINGIKVAGKNARQSALLALEKLFELFAQGGKYITDFFTKLSDDVAKWFLKNKKGFVLVEKVDTRFLRFIRVLKKNNRYKDSIEYIKLIKRPLGRWLALEQEAAINLYTTGYYILLNKALRKLEGIRLTTEFKAMQKVLDDALNKLPNFRQEGFLLRSTYFTEQEISKLFKVGKDFVDKGYFSTTYSEAALLRWMKLNPKDNTLIKVYGKNGKLIQKSSASEHEAEVLFKSVTKFVVESIKKTDHPLDRRKLITEITLKEK